MHAESLRISPKISQEKVSDRLVLMGSCPPKECMPAWNLNETRTVCKSPSVFSPTLASVQITTDFLHVMVVFSNKEIKKKKFNEKIKSTVCTV